MHQRVIHSINIFSRNIVVVVVVVFTDRNVISEQRKQEKKNAGVKLHDNAK